MWEGNGFFLKGGLGPLGGALATMVSLWGRLVDVIVSSTLEKDVDKVMVPFSVAVKRAWGDSFGQWNMQQC